MRWPRLALFACFTVSCGSRIPHPRYTEQPTSALFEIPYPPPPARVEIVPRSPSVRAVWVNGEWLWEGRRWAWKSGEWAVPPEKGAYAPPVMVRAPDGKLLFAAGAWRDDQGRPIPSPASLKGPRDPAATVVDSEGDAPSVGTAVTDAGR